MCTAATLALLRMLGATSETNLYIWIPLATNCGIFVGLGVKDSLKCFLTNIQPLYLRLVAGFHAIIRDEPHDELPFHIYSISSSTTMPHRRPSFPSSISPLTREFSYANRRYADPQPPGSAARQSH